MPEVSVIIPNYNHAKYLKQRIDSILNQSFEDFEIIILDDCSSDNSRNIIESYRSYPKVKKIIFNESNSGSTFIQWQKGLSLAEGDYIWIAESDDYCDTNFLSTGIELLKNECDFFYCKSIFVDHNNKEIECYNSNWFIDLDEKRWTTNYKSSLLNEANNALHYKNTILNSSSVIFNKKLLRGKLLDKLVHFRYTGDWFFWILLFNNDGAVCYSVNTINYFRITTTSTSLKSKDPFEWNYEMLKIMGSIFSKKTVSKSVRNRIKIYFKENHLLKVPRRRILKYLKYKFIFSLYFK